MNLRLYIATFFLVFSSLSAQSLEKARSFYEKADYYNGKVYLLNLDPDDFEREDQAAYFELLGLTNTRLNQTELAIKNFQRSKALYADLNNPEKSAEMSLELAKAIQMQEGDSQLYKTYLNDFFKYANSTGNEYALGLYYKQLGNAMIFENARKGIEIYRKALYYTGRSKDSATESIIRANMAIVYSDCLAQPDLSLLCLKEARRLLPLKNRNANLVQILINESSMYRSTGNYAKALEVLEQADRVKLDSLAKKNKLVIYQNKADLYALMGDFKNAYRYRDKHQKMAEDLKEFGKTLNVNNLINQMALQDEEAKRSRLRIATFCTVGALILVIILSVLAYKNISRKRKLAEQQKIIETQRLENILNEQELSHIDDMLETQEKERQRIADELHDELGSMLTTLKYNIQHASGSADENWVARTDDLINQTYQKVRNLSHLKNLGVSTQEGLLQSVQRMAEKMDIPGRMAVRVIPFGLMHRLENSLEVTLFRIIMELCTNALKHAEASEIHIYLNEHEDSGLNILIEDNGKGFNVSETTKNDGIGLKKLARKIEQLGGTFTIDSTPGTGTTVIIDLPL